MIYLIFGAKRNMNNLTGARPQSSLLSSNIGAARKVFPHWSQKTVTHHCLSLFPTVSRLGCRTNWLLGLGKLPHDLLSPN